MRRGVPDERHLRGGVVSAVGVVHPIEAESYRILAERVDLSRFGPGAANVVARVIHASADVEFAETMLVDDDAVVAGIAALRAGAPVICDVAMVRHGITGVDARCYLGDVDSSLVAQGDTRSATAMRLAAAHHRAGAIFVVGCAPTALEELLRLATAGSLEPAMVIGLPVGFVGAAESKQALRESGLPSISNVGEKGGSAVAAAALNALARMAHANVMDRADG
jgi:precorrin-8X/cobalt-precorrin-8 methylmutase